MKHDTFDLMCLRALKVNAESEAIALTAASIIVHAHAIVREKPEQCHDALRIIALARSLYAVMPSREAVDHMVETGLAEVAAAGRNRLRVAHARTRLVDRLWRYFHEGAPTSAG